ncbi:octopamine receptor beta-1R-like [Rhopilema esculentum]|uniref:octopamine receptor beta-1R-like n=1 Tax=Rhopilema esculentum TaxID=499914 RepID=UPI0031DC842C
MYFVIPITLVSAVVALIGNILVVIVIMRREPLRSQSAYKFITSLAIADILVSSVAQPLYVSVLMSGSGSYCWLERVSHFFGSLASSASALGLLIVSIDRYIFITKPLHYHFLMTPFRVWFALIYIWVSAVLISLLPYMAGKKAFHIVVFSATILDHFVTGVCYLTIYRVVTMKVSDDLINNQNKSHRQRQATRTVAFVLLAMVICWMPYITASFVWGINIEKWAPDSAMISVYFWLLALGHWNSSVNVMIYSWKNTELRSSLKSFLGIRSQENENLSSNNHNNSNQNQIAPQKAINQSRPETLTVESLV